VWVYILLGIAGHAVMWPAAARFHYRTWHYDSYTRDEEKLFISAIWGFLWPAMVLWVMLITVYIALRYAMTAPSLGERKAAKVKARKERLADLDQQILKAEMELCKATQEFDPDFEEA